MRGRYLRFVAWARSGRAVAVAAVAVAAAVALLGVLLLGDDDSSSPFGTEIARAAERTGGFPGARVEFTGTADEETVPGGMTMTGTGVMNGKTGRSFLRMTASGPRLPIGEFTTRQITDGAVFYMASPMFAGELGDKRWMKLDLTGDEAVSEAMGSSGDPREQLRMLRAVSDDVELLGEEEVRGVACKRYAATIDLNRQVELYRDEGKDEAAENLEKLIEAGNGSEQDIEVWVGEGLVRRMVVSMPFGALAGPGAEMEMSMELFDFGITPRIEVPPDDEVEDLTDEAKAEFEKIVE